MAQSTKNVFVISGPNGAGKTTSAFSLMPEIIQCEEYINADSIAAGDYFKLKINRDADNVGDTLIGDTEIIKAVVRE